MYAESFALNVLANHRLARQLLPDMRERGQGHLIVIGSTATDRTSLHMTAYAATKKALRALYEGWELELAGTGVRTTLIAPGATLTSSWDGQALPPRMLAATDVAAAGVPGGHGRAHRKDRAAGRLAVVALHPELLDDQVVEYGAVLTTIDVLFADGPHGVHCPGLVSHAEFFLAEVIDHALQLGFIATGDLVGVAVVNGGAESLATLRRRSMSASLSIFSRAVS